MYNYIEDFDDYSDNFPESYLDISQLIIYKQ